jgi:hypothetical protein
VACEAEARKRSKRFRKYKEKGQEEVKRKGREDRSGKEEREGGQEKVKRKGREDRRM